MKSIIDLTIPIETNMPTCGTPWHQSVEVHQMGTLDDVGRNTSRFLLGSHSGTHMDAPTHFIQGGKTLENLDLNILCGPVKILDFTNVKENGILIKTDFEKCELGERILLRYGWYKNWKTDKYYRAFPYIDLEAAEYLIERGVKLIAMDTPSPDMGAAIGEKDDSPVHKLLLQNEVIIVEYLTNTDQIRNDTEYEIIALPLKIVGVDGSPSRVLLREL